MDNNWQLYRTSSPSLKIPAVGAGAYQVELVAIDALGNRSLPAVAYPKVEALRQGAAEYGNQIEPVADVSMVAVSPMLALASWTPARNAGLFVAVRHSPDPGGTAWGSSSPLDQRLIPSSAGQALLPALEGVYAFRHVNAAGTLSPAATFVAFTPAPSPASIQVAAIDEAATGFLGSKENCIFDPAAGGLRLNVLYWDDLAPGGDFDALPGLIDSYGTPLADAIRWDDLAPGGDFDALPGLIDSYGQDGRIGIYNFASGLDLGAVYSAELRRACRSRSRFLAPLWDSLVGLVDDILSLEEAQAESGVITMEFRSSSEPLATATAWSEWRPLTCCSAMARSLQFRARLSVADLNQDVVALNLGLTIRLPQVIEASSLISSAAATNPIVFASGFYAPPSIAVTPFNMATGDYFVIGGLTATGFNITFRNAAGTAVARDFQFQATGFGRR